MASAQCDSMDLSLTDLDHFNHQDERDLLSSGANRNCGSLNSASLDLEMDYIPGPPTYEESVAPLTTNPQATPYSQSSQPNIRAPGLRGPNTQSRASRRRPPLGSSNETSNPTSSRRDRGNPAISEEGENSTSAQPQPRHRRTQADSSRPRAGSEEHRRTARRTSNGGTSHGGGQSAVEVPVRGRANGVTLRLEGGNVVINNNIDIQLGSPHHMQTRAQKKKATPRPLPAQGSKRPIATEDIELLSPLLGDNWFGIGWSLGVDKGVLENIRKQYERDQCEMTRQMFRKWKGKFGRKATINYVLDALTDEKFCMYDVAERIPKD